MPLRVTISPAELKARTIVSPDWYTCILKSVTREKSKSGDAFNYVFSWVGQEGAAQDVPFKQWISEKDSSIGQIGDIASALGFAVDENKGFDGDLEAFVGGKARLKIRTGEYNGQPKNEIAAFGKINL